MRAFAPSVTLKRSLTIQLTLWAILCALVAVICSESSIVTTWRERLFDVMTAQWAPDAASRPIVVEIDEQTVEQVGAWPWSRDQLAYLMDAIGAAGPRALGVDILLDGPDRHSPAANARRLAAILKDPSLNALSSQLPDGEEMLKSAMARTPTILGVAQGPSGRPPPTRPILLTGEPLDPNGLWRTAGVIAPEPELLLASAGFGSLALVGDQDGTVRRAPILTVAADKPVFGLSVELYGLVAGTTPLIVDGGKKLLRLPNGDVPIGPDGFLRLAPVSDAVRDQRRVSAVDILNGEQEVVSRLKGAVVLLGAVAAGIADLRSQYNGALIPGVTLKADAYAQLSAGVFPQRPAWFRLLEILTAFIAAVLVALTVRRFAPQTAALIVIAAIAAWLALSGISGVLFLTLIDPITPTLACVATFAVCGVLAATEARKRSERIRARFEQHLSPDLVQRIANTPDLLRLQGETREVTVVFTDIEGFSAMTERADPEKLISALDTYFDGLTRIAISHGGLVMRFVGDAAQILFNAPLDTPEHAQKGLACAIDIGTFTQSFENSIHSKSLGFGRTRIGVESGLAIVGDVGGARKLDYTAHGSAVNAAARLEQTNKKLGTWILVGPAAAKAIKGIPLRSVGMHDIRGFDRQVELFTVSESVQAQRQGTIQLQK